MSCIIILHLAVGALTSRMPKEHHCLEKLLYAALAHPDGSQHTGKILLAAMIGLTQSARAGEVRQLSDDVLRVLDGQSPFP